MFSFNAFLNACALQALSYNIADLCRNVCWKKNAVSCYDVKKHQLTV